MANRSFRDVVKWVALANALVLFPFDWYCRSTYWHINSHGVGETTTRPAVGLVWLFLCFVTFLSGLISLPKWQSFLAIMCMGWTVLMTIQLHWP
jgi:hypothetical protein